MKDPILVRKCLHRFCKSCLKTQESLHVGNSLAHRNCPLCKAKIGNKRLILKDDVMDKIIRHFLPTDEKIDKFN
jgi:hypothetical protein